MRRSCLAAALAFALLIPATASASWRGVKRFLGAQSKIVHETSETLVIYNATLDRSLTLATEFDVDADIHGEIKYRRGGNPYRVWYTTAKLHQRPDMPKKLWGKFLEAPFLRLLRPPKEKAEWPSIVRR